MFRKILIAAVVPAVVAAMWVTTGTASAAPGTVYCLNGVSTTLPAEVGFQGGSVSLSEKTAQFVISGLSGGPFYAGKIGTKNYFLFPDFPGQTPEGIFDPGWSTNFVSLGACTAAPGPAHVGVCKGLTRADGTVGLFQDVPIYEWNNATGMYFDAPAANWVEGLGLTCDDPIALGYKAAGYSVAWGGKPDPNNDPKALRGSGFNNIYPYFTK